MTNKITFIILCSLLLNCKNSNEKSADTSKDIAEAIHTIAKTEKEVKPSKNTEIVFCLDATGSMSGLIDTAKEKIWDIVSDLAQNEDIDTLKMGMVFYRDRGDVFVTKQIPITIDLDEVYADLLEIQADGGGDTPESVNQALYESVTNMKWSSDKNTYKTIFVVGDCPPHMDYLNDIKYTESCKLAAEKGITINTIKLGNSCSEAITHFKKMSECTNGSYLKLDQNAEDYTIATPYDSQITDVSKAIDNSRMYYGTTAEREYNYDKKDKSMKVYDDGSVTANSSRAEYKNSKVGKKGAYGTNEIINDYNDGKLKLDFIKEDELPKELRGMSKSQIETKINDLANQRKENYSKMQELIKLKNQYIKSKESEQTGKKSFSKEVIKIIKEQSEKDI
ncbi:vWA domain-containing protein [Psychroserpens ponticola]|uniref:VWA domain-containing protein n=1 Tax=Psychroserpens ponticola TaxID=2932268 RepID=A0ABY7S1R1_9FLAO|nr:vWA domain-containing protein [Psychroserpens ponticola]WCO03282.1 VWA domain-containing protein [Psychroserpens ponticola]